MSVQYRPADLDAQMRVKDVFDPRWLLNAAKVFPLEVSASRRDARPNLPPMRPDSEEALAACISDTREAVSIVGGGTRLHPGEGAGARLDVSGLSGIVLYEPEALTVVVRAGTRLADVQAALAAEGQMLGFEPLGAPGSTIGGVVAANASGPRRVQAGAARDALIGVRFVDGNGDLIRNGGRVMKNVTGYDLVKLMAGSRGRLGC